MALKVHGEFWQAEHNYLSWNVARRAEVKHNSKHNHDLEWSLIKIAQGAHRGMAVLWSGTAVTMLLVQGEGMAVSNTF